MSKLPSALTAVALSSILVAILSPDIELMSMIPRGLPSLRMPVANPSNVYFLIVTP